MKAHRLAIIVLLGFATAGMQVLKAEDRPEPIVPKSGMAEGHLLRFLDDGRFIVRTTEGQELVLSDYGGSMLRLDGAAAELNQFRSGMRVQIIFEPKDERSHRVVALFGRTATGP